MRKYIAKAMCFLMIFCFAAIHFAQAQETYNRDQEILLLKTKVKLLDEQMAEVKSILDEGLKHGQTSNYQIQRLNQKIADLGQEIKRLNAKIRNLQKEERTSAGQIREQRSFSWENGNLPLIEAKVYPLTRKINPGARMLWSPNDQLLFVDNKSVFEIWRVEQKSQRLTFWYSSVMEKESREKTISCLPDKESDLLFLIFDRHYCHSSSDKAGFYYGAYFLDLEKMHKSIDLSIFGHISSRNSGSYDFLEGDPKNFVVESWTEKGFFLRHEFDNKKFYYYVDGECSRARELGVCDFALPYRNQGSLICFLNKKTGVEAALSKGAEAFNFSKLAEAYFPPELSKWKTYFQESYPQCDYKLESVLSNQNKEKFMLTFYCQLNGVKFSVIWDFGRENSGVEDVVVLARSKENQAAAWNGAKNLNYQEAENLRLLTELNTNTCFAQYKSEIYYNKNWASILPFIDDGGKLFLMSFRQNRLLLQLQLPKSVSINDLERQTFSASSLGTRFVFADKQGELIYYDLNEILQ